MSIKLSNKCKKRSLSFDEIVPKKRTTSTINLFVETIKQNKKLYDEKALKDYTMEKLLQLNSTIERMIMNDNISVESDLIIIQDLQLLLFTELEQRQ